MFFRFAALAYFSALLLFCSSLLSRAQAGDLDDANAIIRGSDDDDDDRPSYGGDSSSDDDDSSSDESHDSSWDDWNSSDGSGDSSGECSDICGYVLVATVFPWALPYALIEGSEYPSALGFRDYPYQDGSLGHAVYEIDEDAIFARDSAGRVSLGVGYMGNDGWRASGRARWMHSSRFDFDVTAIGFGEFDDGEIDAATFLSTHIGLRFVETDTFTMRSGIGASLWQTQGLWAGGFDFYYGFDWFLVEPIVFSLNMELGSLGEAFRFGFQGSMGALIGRTELFIGWEHFVLANDVGVVELGGPQVGVRLWL